MEELFDVANASGPQYGNGRRREGFETNSLVHANAGWNIYDFTGEEAPVRRRDRGDHLRALVLSTKRRASIQRRLAVPENRVALVPHSSCSRETVRHRTKPATTGWVCFNGSKRDEAWHGLAAAALAETAHPLQREPCYSFVFFRPCRSCCEREREAWWGV